MEQNVLEFVDHLHEHFLTPCSINSNGRYNVPSNPEEGYRYVHVANLGVHTNNFSVLKCTNRALPSLSFPMVRIGSVPVVERSFKHAMCKSNFVSLCMEDKLAIDMVQAYKVQIDPRKAS